MDEKHYKFIEEDDRCICKEDIPEIKMWLEYNDINAEFPMDEPGGKKSKYTLLEIAIDNNALEVVKFLVENGANLYHSSPENSGWNTLTEMAACLGHIEILKYLIEGCKFDKKAFLSDNSLIYAAINNYPEIIKYLINQGKDIEQRQISPPLSQHEAPDGVYYTPVMSEEERKKRKGSTALRLAVQENSIESVKILCERGANLEVDYGMSTPLYSAAAEGHLEIVKILIEYGANLNHTFNGTTPYQIAKTYKHSNIADYLLNCGAKK